MEVHVQSMVRVIHVHVLLAFQGQTAKKRLVLQHLVLMEVHALSLVLVSSALVQLDTQDSHVRSLHVQAPHVSTAVYVQIQEALMFALAQLVTVVQIVIPHHAHQVHVKMVEHVLTMAQRTHVLVYLDTPEQIVK